MIPILRDHDWRAAPIGYIYCGGGRLHIEFAPDVEITKGMLFEIFGDAGVQLTEHTLRSDGTIIVRKAQILEFSLVAAPPATQSNTPTTQSQRES